MEGNAKIRINLNLREFEIEGSEDFINSHSEKIDSFLEILKTTPPTPQPTIIQQPVVLSTTQNPAPNPKLGSIPETFGEYLHLLSNNAKDIDKVLLAGHFAQASSESGSFSTSDTTQLLIDQGIKLTNPSQTIKNNLDTKRIIKLSKGKFKVSKDGADYLQQLLSPSNT